MLAYFQASLVASNDFSHNIIYLQWITKNQSKWILSIIIYYKSHIGQDLMVCFAVQRLQEELKAKPGSHPFDEVCIHRSSSVIKQ